MKKVNYFHSKLPNGLETVFWPIKGIETVVAELWIKSGGWYETEIKRGTFHFLEHVLTHGCKKYPSFGQLVEIEEDLGLKINDSVGGARTQYNIRFPKATFSRAIEFLSEYVFEPIFPTEAIELERKIILQEYFDYWDSPNKRFGKKVAENYWGKDHPYAYMSSLGTKESIENIFLEDLLLAHRKYYVPSNMVLVIVGDLDKEKVKQVIEKSFGGRNKTDFTAEIDYSKPLLKKELITHEEKIEQIVFSSRFPLFEFEENDWRKRYITTLVSYLLGSSRRSRLTRLLREKEPLAYSAGCSLSAYPQGNVVVAGFSTSMENSFKTAEMFKQEIDRVKVDGFSEEEFKAAKKYYTYQISLSVDTIYSVADNLMEDLFFKGKIYLPDDLRLVIEKITLEDLNNAAKAIFNFNKVKVGIMGKAENLKKVKDLGVDKIF